MKRALTILGIISAFNFTFGQIPTDNLIMHLIFDGSAEDISGNDLDGIVLGPTLTDNRYGIAESAYNFDGLDDNIYVPSDPLLDVDFPFSVSLWYFRSEPIEEVETLFKSDANNAIYSGFWISMAATGEIAAGYGDGIGYGIGHRVSKRTTAPLSLGEWHNVLAVFNSLEDIDLYIDCELTEGTYSGTGTVMGYLGENTTIGRYDWRFFEGEIDDIRVYSDAITEDEARYFCLKEQSNSIDEITPDSTLISIYPNPTSNILNVNFGPLKDLNSEYTYSITDLCGKTLYTSIIKNQSEQINLNNLDLANGMYLLQIQNESLELVQAARFIYQ